jgi:outer membrane protein insertion porin family
MASRVTILGLCAVLTAFGQSTTTRKTRKPAVQTPAAKPAAPAMTAWPVGKLEVEGNKLYSDEQILSIAGLKVGQMAGKAEFDAARDRLLATGAFESIGYKFNPIPGTRTNAGILQVDEITQLFPYRFEELRVDDKTLRAHLKAKEPLFSDRIPATKPMLDRMTKHVEEVAKDAGGIVARLEGVGNLMVVFRPSSLPSVAEVHFKGNKAIPTAKLQQAAAGAAVGAVFTENRFRQVLDASIRPVYEAAGYLGVQFPKFEVAPAKNVKGIAVTVEVQEGEIYKLSEVELKGELAESKELLKTGGFKIGEPANFDQIRTGVEDIRKALRRNGYIEAKTSFERKLDDKEKTLTLIVTADPGPQFMMGKLTIEGLDLETEPHIRKMWALKKGQPFNAEYPDYFLNRLIADQVMDNLGKTSSSIAPNPESKTVDVTLKLEGEKKKPTPERPTP